jgi:hypothetical protein
MHAVAERILFPVVIASSEAGPFTIIDELAEE